MFHKMLSFSGVLALAGAAVLLTAGPGLAQRPPVRSSVGSTSPFPFVVPPDLVSGIRRSYPYGNASSIYPNSSAYGRPAPGLSQSPGASSNYGWNTYYNYYPHYGESRNGFPYYSSNYGNTASYGYSGSYLDSYPEGTPSAIQPYSPPPAPNGPADGYVPTGGLPLQYPPPTDDGRTAEITVKVPANAEVWFNQSKTTSTGPVREYRTPPLAAKGRYGYEVRARWQENGRAITQTQRVEIAAGTHTVVNFPTPSGAQAGPAAQAR